MCRPKILYMTEGMNLFRVESESWQSLIFSEKCQWCELNIQGRYYPAKFNFWFTDQDDAILFKLRWDE